MTLVILDFYNYIYRAYYGIRPLTAPNGQMVNAVYGMATMIQSILRDQKPHQFVIVEEGGGSWRKEAFTEYKANRSSMPDDLRSQIVLIKEMISLLNIPMYSVSGQEADDVIASIAHQSAYDRVLIASSDKDLFQLVGPKIQILDTMKQKTFHEADVVEKFGVQPAQIRDYLALVGDTSDNIPGAKGIGEKTAQKLLTEFGSIEGIYKSLESIPGKNKEKLHDSKDLVMLSLKLTTLNLELNSGFKAEKYEGPQKEALNEFFTKLNMKSLVSKFDSYSSKS